MPIRHLLSFVFPRGTCDARSKEGLLKVGDVVLRELD